MDARKTMHARKNKAPVVLRPDEKILAQAVISNGIYWKSIAVLCLAILFGVFFAVELFLFLTGVAVLMAVFATVIREILMMVVTDQRVIIRVGTILIETIDLRLDRIESVELQNTLIGQLIGYSSVIVTGTGTRLAYVPFVANVSPIRVAIDEILYKREQKPIKVHPV